MKKMKFGKVFLAILAIMGLVLGGCSGDSSVSTNTASASASSTNGAVDQKVTVSTPDGSSTVTIPLGTTVYSDAAKTQAVSGSLTVTATTISSASALPAAAKTGALVGVANTVLDSVGAIADVTITSGASTIKAFGSPITVNLKLPTGYAAVGSSLDYYSFDSTGAWTKEGSATVKADNSIDMSVSHLSGWGVASFKSTLPTATGFTAAMISGKTFSYSSVSTSGGTKTGSMTFNADGTASGSTMTGTWSINSSGQLVTVHSSGETDTFTLISATSSLFTATMAWQNGSNTGSSTLTATVATGGEITTPGFTTAMVSGKTFSYSSVSTSGGTKTGSMTFNADGTASGSTMTGTWSINSSGQLVTVHSSGETDTFTLISATSSLFTATMAWQNGSNTGSSTLTATIAQ